MDAKNDDQKRGVDIVRQAIRMPCWQIASNAGVDASVIVIVKKVIKAQDESTGYDALNDKFVNMMEAGIIDPTKVGGDSSTQKVAYRVTLQVVH